MDSSYTVGGVVLPRPFKAVRLGHCGLWQPDVRTQLRHYVDLLGLHHSDDVVGTDGEPLISFTTCNTDHHAFVTMSPKSVSGERLALYEKGVTVNQISFQVNSLQEINDAHAFFTARGVRISRIGRDLPGSNWAVYAYDPDGHRVELFYGMEQLGWNLASKPREMYQRLPYETIPLPQRAEAQEVAEARAQGLDLAQRALRGCEAPYVHEVGGVLMQRPFKISKVGPVRIFVSDLDASERFYRDIIGLHKTAEVLYQGQRCVYFRAGLEHHSLTLVPDALRDVLCRGKTTLATLGFQVQTYAQLKAARDYLQAHGVKRVDLPAELHPGVDYAFGFTFDGLHNFELYFQMAQLASEQAIAPVRDTDWPDQLRGHASVFADQTRPGPLA